MFKVDEEFFDLELDDDIFHDVFNITTKCSTQLPLKANPVALLKHSEPEHATEPRNDKQDIFEVEAEKELQCEIDLPKDTLGKQSQSLDGTNSSKQLPRLLSSDSEVGLSSNFLGVQHGTVINPDDGRKHTGSNSGLSKDVKFTNQKRLPFMSYEDDDLNSVFNFESVEECSVNKSSGNCIRSSENVKSKLSVFEESGQQKRTSLTKHLSFPAAKYPSVLSTDKAVTGTSNDSKSNSALHVSDLKRNSVSTSSVSTSPLGVVNEHLNRYTCIQKASSPFSDGSRRGNNSAPLNQSTPRHVSSIARKRKFPGPAGILPELPPGANLSTLSEPESPIVRVSPKNAAPQEFLCSQTLVDEFEKGPWQMMLNDLACEGSTASIIERYNISWVLQLANSKQLPKGKVPVLCIILKNISFQGSEARVTFGDKTGEIHGMIHGKLLEEHQEKLQPGSVLVLKQVTVFSPNLRKHYLLITPSNIISLYGISGDKTSVAEYSGSQLMAMAEEWMQEDSRIPRTGSGNKQFSWNSPCLRREMSPHSPAIVQSPNDSAQGKLSGNVFAKQIMSDRPSSFGAKIRASLNQSPQKDKNIAQTSTNSVVTVSPTNSLNSSPLTNHPPESETTSEMVACGTDMETEGNVISNASGCQDKQPVIVGTGVSENGGEEECAAFEDEFDDLFLNLDEEALLSDKW